ncbi:hypothetical protein BV20DRAFT_1049756 [Pilatotrama ljubarskyi]|nr:hypothetical protein BV20DRAFT_1049756 [Pilatotrama ljubarskyi]
MSEILAQEAINEAHLLCESALAIIQSSDRALGEFLASFALPSAPAEWLEAYVGRLMFLDKERRRKVCDELCADAACLRAMLVPSPDYYDPVEALSALIPTMECGLSEARELYNELHALYGSDSGEGTLRGFARATVVRLLESLAHPLSELENDRHCVEAALQDGMSYFMVLFREDHLHHITGALLTPAERSVIVEAVEPFCKNLGNVVKARGDVFAKLNRSITIHTVEWMAFEKRGVPRDELDAVKRTFGALSTELELNRALQDQAIQSLQMLADGPRFLPSSVSGLGDTELSVGRLRAAAGEFERLRLRCARTGRGILSTARALKEAMAKSNSGSQYALTFHDVHIV